METLPLVFLSNQTPHPTLAHLFSIWVSRVWTWVSRGSTWVLRASNWSNGYELKRALPLCILLLNDGSFCFSLTWIFLIYGWSNVIVEMGFWFTFLKWVFDSILVVFLLLWRLCVWFMKTLICKSFFLFQKKFLKNTHYFLERFFCELCEIISWRFLFLQESLHDWKVFFFFSYSNELSFSSSLEFKNSVAVVLCHTTHCIWSFTHGRSQALSNQRDE